MSLLQPLSGYSCLRCFLMVLALTTVNIIARGQIKYGTVTNNSKPVSGAVVENLKTKSVSMSGATGDFIMMLKKGDVLLTSYPGFYTDTTIYNNQTSLVITLKTLPGLLEEVTITERLISPLDKLQKNQNEYRQIYRIGDDSHMVSVMGAFAFAGVAINIDALYNHFSKAGKNARKLQKTLIRDYHDDVVDNRYTKGLVTKYTGYEGKQLDDFMIDNRPTYDFMTHASDYDVIEFIIKAKKSAPVKESNLVAQNGQASY